MTAPTKSEIDRAQRAFDDGFWQVFKKDLHWHDMPPSFDPKSIVEYSDYFVMNHKDLDSWYVCGRHMGRNLAILVDNIFHYSDGKAKFYKSPSPPFTLLFWRVGPSSSLEAGFRFYGDWSDEIRPPVIAHR